MKLRNIFIINETSKIGFGRRTSISLNNEEIGLIYNAVQWAIGKATGDERFADKPDTSSRTWITLMDRMFFGSKERSVDREKELRSVFPIGSDTREALESILLYIDYGDNEHNNPFKSTDSNKRKLAEDAGRWIAMTASREVKQVSVSPAGGRLTRKIGKDDPSIWS